LPEPVNGPFLEAFFFGNGPDFGTEEAKKNPKAFDHPQIFKDVGKLYRVFEKRILKENQGFPFHAGKAVAQDLFPKLLDLLHFGVKPMSPDVEPIPFITLRSGQSPYLAGRFDHEGYFPVFRQHVGGG
jgi:hypothetical protein